MYMYNENFNVRNVLVYHKVRPDSTVVCLCSFNLQYGKNQMSGRTIRKCPLNEYSQVKLHK